MIGCVVMEIDYFMIPPQKFNMAAKMSDLNELRNLDSLSTDIHIQEI